MHTYRKLSHMHTSVHRHSNRNNKSTLWWFDIELLLPSLHVASLSKPFLSHVYCALHCNLSWPVSCRLPIKIPLNYRTLCLINLMDAPSVIPRESREKSCEGKRESDFFGLWMCFSPHITQCVNDVGYTTQAHIYHLLLCSSVFNMLDYIFPTPWYRIKSLPFIKAFSPVFPLHWKITEIN